MLEKKTLSPKENSPSNAARDAIVSKPLKYLVFLVAILLPLFLCGNYIHQHAVNGVWQDEWAFVDYLRKFDLGIYDFAGLFQYQHNEHKLFFPSLFLILVAHLSHYDGVTVQYVGLGIIFITAICLLTISWQRVKQLPFAAAWLIPVVLITFTLRQWENLICCFPYSILSVTLFFVVTIFLLDNQPRRNWCFPLGLLSAVCCTYSYGNGLLVWPLGLLQLLGSAYFLADEERRDFLRNSVIWSVFGILLCTYYFSTYLVKKSFAGYVLFQHFQEEPGRFFQLFIDSLANSLVGYPNWALVGGLIILGLAISTLFCFSRRTYMLTRLSLAPISLLLFGLISTVLIFFSRAGMGSLAVLCSRYSSLTNVWIIGFYLLVSQMVLPKSKASLALLAPSVIALLIVVGYAVSFQEAQAEGDKLSYVRLVAANELLNYKVSSDEILMDVLPFPQMVRSYAPYLEEKRYSVFKETSQSKRHPRENSLIPPEWHFESAGMSLEDFPGWAKTPLHPVTYGLVKFSGWIVDKTKPHPRVKSVFVNIDGKQEFQAACGLCRLDVCDYLHHYEDSYKYSGFRFVCKPDIFAKGEHSVSIRAIASNGDEYMSPKLAKFTMH